MKIPRVPVLVLKHGEAIRETAMVIPESRFDIRVNEKSVAGIICRPENPEEPSVGFLNNFGLFKSPEVIKSIRVHPQEHVVSIQASVEDEAIKEVARSVSAYERLPGRTVAQAAVRDPAARPRPVDGRFETLSSMSERFGEALELKGIFGAYHVAALADKEGKLVCQAGDVGLGITVDRLLGRAFLTGVALKERTLLISGRLRVSTVSKAAYHGIDAVMTTSVITHLALDTAVSAGIEIIHTKDEGTITIYGRDTAEKAAAEGGE